MKHIHMRTPYDNMCKQKNKLCKWYHFPIVAMLWWKYVCFLKRANVRRLNIWCGINVCAWVISSILWLLNLLIIQCISLFNRMHRLLMLSNSTFFSMHFVCVFFSFFYNIAKVDRCVYVIAIDCTSICTVTVEAEQ